LGLFEFVQLAAELVVVVTGTHFTTRSFDPICSFSAAMSAAKSMWPTKRVEEYNRDGPQTGRYSLIEMIIARIIGFLVGGTSFLATARLCWVGDERAYAVIFLFTALVAAFFGGAIGMWLVRNRPKPPLG
jgi:hypothetical protein